MFKKTVTLIALSMLIFFTVCFSMYFYGKNTVIFSTSKSDGAFYELSGSNLSNYIKFYGYTLKGDKNFNYLNLVENLKAKEVYKKVTEENTELLYYSNLILKSEIINGKKVNLHVYITGETTTVGIPYIYYGF